MFNTSQSRWRAVQTRCEQSRSAFVYAVLTTRIYCRPTCPARLARRANVVFYDNASAATAAGSRPCKRCKPEEQQDDGDDVQQKAVRKACKILEQASQVKTVNELAKAVQLSPRYFHSVFKKVMGMTPREYTRQMNLAQDQQGLNGSHDVKGSPRSAGVYSDSWLALNSQSVEDENNGILENDFAEFGLFLPLTFEHHFVDGKGQPTYSALHVLPGQTPPQSDGALSGHDGNPSEISASNTAWLAQHNLSASHECSSDSLDQLSFPVNIEETLIDWHGSSTSGS